jgi:hypothetical protein
MTRQVRSWAIAALAVFALAGAAAPSFAGITYNVTNDLTNQNGWSVNGTITVSGVGSYTNSSAIEAWDITLSKPSTGSYQFTNALSGHDGIGLGGGILTASTGTLDLGVSSYLQFYNFGFSNELKWDPSNNNYFANFAGARAFDTGVFSPSNSFVWTIGTATPSAVPEIDPAMGSSALSLVAGVLAMIEQRRRRATLVA